MSKETPDELTARLLDSIEGLGELEDFQSQSAPVEAEVSGPVKVVHIPDFVWGAYTSEPMSILLASGFTSAMILVGSREGDTVVARTGIYLRPNGSSVSDEEILEHVRATNAQYRAKGVEVVGALIAQNRSKTEVEELMTRQPSLQVIMVGYPSDLSIGPNGVVPDIKVLPYTRSPGGGLQFISRFEVDRT